MDDFHVAITARGDDVFRKAFFLFEGSVRGVAGYRVGPGNGRFLLQPAWAVYGK